MSSIPVLQDANDYLKPKPEINLIMDRIMPLQDMTQENMINIIKDLNLTDIQLLLFSSGNNKSQLRLIFKRDFIPSSRFYFGYYESLDTSLPFSYTVFIKNEGKGETKEKLSGNINLGTLGVKCVYNDASIEVICNEQRSFNPKVFFETKDKFIKGDKVEFRFNADNLYQPIITCNNGQNCIVSVYDLVPFIIKSSAYPMVLNISNEQVIIPDYRNTKGVWVYDMKLKNWTTFIDNDQIIFSEALK